MVALPNLQVSSNPATWGGGLTGGGGVPVSAGAPATSQAGGGGGTLGMMSGMGSYNPFPSGAPTFGAAGAPSAASPAGGWTASNLPGGGMGAAAPATVTTPAAQTAGQNAVSSALVAGPGANVPAGSVSALPTMVNGVKQDAPAQPANTTLIGAYYVPNGVSTSGYSGLYGPGVSSSGPYGYGSRAQSAATMGAPGAV